MPNPPIPTPLPTENPPHPQPDADTGSVRERAWPFTPTPISVWLSPPLLDCPHPTHRGQWPPCPWQWPPALWRDLITAYTHPGDHVLIADAGPGLPAVTAASTLGRSLAARVPGRAQRVLARRLGLSPHSRRRVVVFAGPDHDHTVPLWPARARRTPADLLIIPAPCAGAWPTLGALRPTGPADPDVVVAWQLQVLTASIARVRPGGVIAVLTATTPRREGLIDRLTPITTGAQHLGLAYLQHHPIIHTTPHTAGDASRPGGPPPLHASVHADLLTFIRPGGAQ